MSLSSLQLPPPMYYQPCVFVNDKLQCVDKSDHRFMVVGPSTEVEDTYSAHILSEEFSLLQQLPSAVPLSIWCGAWR